MWKLQKHKRNQIRSVLFLARFPFQGHSLPAIFGMIGLFFTYISITKQPCNLRMTKQPCDFKNIWQSGDVPL